MARLSLLALAFCAATTVYSLPHGDAPTEARGCCKGYWGQDSTPTLPLDEVNNSGPTPLPTPSTDVKYVLLGLGFQNYSCSATQANPSGAWIQSVSSAGAIADLYDITKFVSKSSKDIITRNTLKSFEACLAVTDCTPSPQNNFCEACHKIAGAPYRKNQLGDHFFSQINGAQTPNFDISKKGDFISAKKAGGVNAPDSAYDGENALGTIPWLYLVPNASGLTKNIASAYRVQTAGGVAPSSCGTLAGQLQVPYTAEYWFY